MTDVVIVEAVRTPIGRRNGGLSTVHPADLLATVLREIVDRAGIDPAQVGQVVTGCVSQVGEQSFNVGRTAWLTAGRTPTVPPRGLPATGVRESVARTGTDPGQVGPVVTGGVSQVGEQSRTVGRTPWLTAGLPLTTPATTVDTQCGSSQQATNLATS